MSDLQRYNYWSSRNSVIFLLYTFSFICGFSVKWAAHFLHLRNKGEIIGIKNFLSRTNDVIFHIFDQVVIDILELLCFKL